MPEGKRILLLPVHGMGETRRDYWQPLVHGLEKKVKAPVWKKLHVEPIYYQDVVQNNQDALWSRMLLEHKLDWQSLRKFMLNAFSDAATLEHHSDRPNSPYLAAQRIIRDSLHSALEKLAIKSAPVIVIAHSLGCQVISNYIWDAQHGSGIWNEPAPYALTAMEEDFLKLKSLRLMLTTGCNIPFFVSGLDEIVAIKKPSPAFRWYNYFDRDDILAWPLKPLSPSYRRLVTRDIQINAGSLLSSWNPSSHNGYWSDRDFIAPAANHIENAGD